MKTQREMIVTSVGLEEHDPDEAGLVVVRADGIGWGHVRSVEFVAGIGERWAVSDTVVVTVQDESDEDWTESGSLEYDPGPRFSVDTLEPSDFVDEEETE